MSKQDERYRRLRRLSDSPFTALTVKYAQRYLKRYPKDGPSWLRLGIALVELARYQDAKRALAKAADLCPAGKCQVPLSQMGHLFDAMGDYDEAGRWYERAIDTAPNDASYYIYLGGVLAKSGRLYEAEQVHRAATRCLEGCIDEAYLNLGYVLRAQERFEEAADCFREAIRLDPDYRLAKTALQDVEKCLQWLRRRKA